jgi:hypothetical protein
MNIFEILTSGNRRLKEEHVSAVLCWLLDPDHDHGLGIELLKRMSSAYFPESALSRALAGGEFSGLNMRERRRLRIRTELEATVLSDDANERAIDILVNVNDQITLAIENKIGRGAVKEVQLREQVEGLHSKLPNAKIHFLFLTPHDAGPAAKRAIDAIPSGKLDAKPVQVFWSAAPGRSDTDPVSIADVLKNILRDESEGRASPLSSETKFLIKSFIRFIDNGFSYVQGRMENSDSDEGVFDGLDEVRYAVDRNPELFIGFKGGPPELKDRIAQAASDGLKRTELEERRYKWCRQVDSGKTKSNWLPIREFLQLFEGSGF